MIYYEEERKELIIPSGFLPNGGGNCEEAIADAKAEQEAADRAKLEYGEITDNGFFWPKSGFGFSVVNVNIPQEYINCVEVLMLANNMPEYDTSRFNVSDIYVNGHRAGNSGVRTGLVTGDRGIGFNLVTNETEVRTLSCVYTFYNDNLGADFPRDFNFTIFLGCDWTTGGAYSGEYTVTELLAYQNYYKYRVDCDFTDAYYKFPDPCKNAINSAFQSGYTVGRRTKEIRFDFYNNGTFTPPWSTGHSITINGNETEGVQFYQTGNFDTFVGRVLTSESAITTMELTINFQSGGADEAPMAFSSVVVNEDYNLTILSQSRELVGEPRVYKYTFTFNNTPLYDKASYEAGLAACQNNEQED